MRVTDTRLLAIAGAAAVGGAIVYAMRPQGRYSGIKLKKSIIVNRPPELLYTFWRDFTNLPRIADILESVEVLGEVRSRWTATAPGGIPVQWEAEITKDIPHEMIGWRSTPGSRIETAGYVKFEELSRGRTLVRVALEYDLPAGEVGAAVASLFGKRPGAHIDSLLERFKRLMETEHSY